MNAIATLIECFDNPLDEARARQTAGDRVVGVTAHTVPWELLRAVGLSPVVIRPTRHAATYCDESLEPGVFGSRAKSLFEAAMTGDLAFLTALVFTRSSEQDYKIYLYLREIVREGRGAALPPLWFYDLLHSPSAQAYDYGLARTRELMSQMQSLAERSSCGTNLESAVGESNHARAAVRRLLALRGSRPRLSGSEALALIGAFFLMDRGRYAALANAAAAEVAHRAPFTGPRLVVAGAWLDDARLHGLLESHGGVVVAEDGAWGSRCAGRDIEHRDDLVAAIFEKYYRDGPSVRQFPPADFTWLHDLSPADIDGVVFYVPPDDSVMGWNVPVEQRRFDDLGIPSIVIRDDLDNPGMSSRCEGPITAFIGRAARRPS